MTDVQTPPTPLVADTTGSSETFEKMPSYDIAPEDKELADSITKFDPYGTPSPIEGKGEFRIPERFTAKVLPDAMRKEVEQQIARLAPGSDRDQREHDLTMAALRQNSLGVRVRLGLGSGADQYQREAFAIQRDMEKIEADAAAVLNSLNEVVRIEVTGVDPVTGEQLTKTIYRAEGDTRRALELRHAELMRHLAALDGVEGDRRLKKALFGAVEDAKAMQRKVDVHAKARALAGEMLDKEEIEHLAKSFAANRRHSIG